MGTASMTYEQLNTLDVWRRFATITLDKMRGVKLMNRIDTKYLLTEREVLQLLERAAAMHYRVQVVEDNRACRYDTLYYDTAGRDMYVVHHNQQLSRQKIRTRRYVESGVVFLEIKNKSNRGRTRKRRVEICDKEFGDFAANSSAMALFGELSRYRIELLSPALATRFVRITLVNEALSERLTIDLNLHYEDVRSGVRGAIERMAIVELKQDGRTDSQMKIVLRDMRIAPFKVSKYCLGTALTVDGVKKNRYKSKIRDIRKRVEADEN
ncbi:MAG: polyphosphate polymerase domain-containing protein [Alistipes sp.]|nr:polyphosphate polymerase domain-containing protein [Alistipes sp.]